MVGDTPTKTLPPEDGKLNLRHIQPTPVLRGIVKLKFFSDPLGLLGIKGFIQRTRLVCIEVIANQQNLFCVWEMHIHYISADMCEINASALVCDFNVSKAEKGCENHKQIADAIAFIFRIISIRFAWHHWERRTHFLKVLFTRLIDTHYRTPRVFRARIEV